VSVKLDKIDLMIIRKLIQNGNTPYKNIADELGITRQTVAKRIKRLFEKGIITSLHISVDYSKLGYPILALILADMQEFSRESIQHALEWAEQQNQSILYWGTISGRWSIFLLAIFRDVLDMEKFLMESRERGIFSKTETSVVMHIYKTPKDWVPPLNNFGNSVKNAKVKTSKNKKNKKEVTSK